MTKFVLKTNAETRQSFSCTHLMQQLTGIWTQTGKQRLLLPLFSMLLISSAIPALSGVEMYANTTDGCINKADNLPLWRGTKGVDCQTESKNSTYFIDKTVKNIQPFIEASSPDNYREAFENTFQLFSHGRPGELFIEGEWKKAEQIAKWLSTLLALSEVEGSPIPQYPNTPIPQYTHLNIYGCEFAQGKKGKAAVSYLEMALGVSIAASDDVTGVDGDWELEIGESKDVIAVSSYAGNLQLCDCKEYLYLNETTNNGIVHKFLINENYNPATDPASAALGAEIGTPWYDNTAAGETLNSPHGLGADLNGFLYIGESGNGDNGNAVRKLTCDGEIIPGTTFEIPNEGGKNFTSANGILYVNTDSESSPSVDANVINAYDLCTGNLIGFYCLDGVEARRDWGMYLEDDGTMYLTSSYLRVTQTSVPDKLWKFNINTEVLNAPGNPTPNCIIPFLTETSSPPTIGQSHFARGHIWGVTVDNNGNIYVVETTQNLELDKPANSTGFRTARILKYDSNGILVAITPWDTAEDGTGWYRAIGIYYNETIDKIFVSTTSAVDDCVALFDTSLNYLGAAVPSPGNGSVGKGINIVTECCPTNSNVTIDTTLCAASVNDILFLQELINCKGAVCEGIWEEDASNSGITYNSCNNSITIDALDVCGKFTLESDGIGNNPQCGAFSITVNVCIVEPSTAPTIAVTNNDCTAGTPGDFTVTTACGAGSTIEWSTDNGTTWSTTAPTYDNTNAQTVIARCVDNVDNTCLSAESAAVTSSPNNCCLVPNCLGISIQQN